MYSLRLCQLVCAFVFAAIIEIHPVTSFAENTEIDPYTASAAQGHFLNPPLVYKTPAPAVASANPFPDSTYEVISVSGQKNPPTAVATTTVNQPAPTVAQKEPAATTVNQLNPSMFPAMSMTYGEKSQSGPGTRSDLGTRSGFELGGQVSYYRYQEHVVANTEFMHETGPKFGITFSGTKVFTSNYFITGDARFAFGENHYSSSGSGTKSGNLDILGELRVVGGKDFILSQSRVAFSPYIGLGYRNLYNDLRGSTSTGAQGYRRDSQYIYLPVGVTNRFGVGSSRIALNAEYDQLLHGIQTSYLSDVGFSDITNHQNGGYGVRGSLMYELSKWSVGPFFNYWNINQSNPSAGAVEPHNQTIEYGLQGRYHF